MNNFIDSYRSLCLVIAFAFIFSLSVNAADENRPNIDSILDFYTSIDAIYLGPINWDTTQEESTGLFYRIDVIHIEEVTFIHAEKIQIDGEGVSHKLISNFEIDIDNLPEHVYEVGKPTWLSWNKFILNLNDSCYFVSLGDKQSDIVVKKCSEVMTPLDTANKKH
jgi:hypothetical protein